MPTQQSAALLASNPLPVETFGQALRFLRKRARLTQDELGRAVGYSREQIARLEAGSRLPDLTVIAALFLPALDLRHETAAAARLLQLAGQARGVAGAGDQRITITHTVRKRVLLEDEIGDLRPAPLMAADGPAPHTPPAPLLSLIGREEAVAQAVALLRGEARLLTLLGAPGVGKTRLALEVARALASGYAHGACFVPLASVQAVEDVPAAIVDALNLTPTTSGAPADAVCGYLAPRELLLVLDNCEHLLEAAPALLGWLAAAPRLKLLCTSRVALDLYGEYEMVVPPLATPDLAALPGVAELAVTPAVQLFVARTQAFDPAFALNTENALAVAGLSVALDGLPLAIELAAARGRQLAPQALLAQIVAARSHHRSSAALLSQTKRGVAERHRTLHDAIAWSVRLLTEAQQRGFMRLGIFAGGCTPDAAAAVSDATAETLDVLARASLVQMDAGAGEPRVMLLETLRAFALEQLAAADQLAAIGRQHATYYADLAQAVFAGVRGEEQTAWLARARREHDNFRAALRWALDAGDGDLAVRIAGGLWWFWYRQGFLNEGRSWLDASLRCPSNAIGQTDDGASILNGEKSILSGTERPVRSEVEGRGQTGAAKRLRAIALNGAGSMAAEQGDYAAAMAYHETGLALRHELQDAVGVSTVLHNMALVALCQGDYEQALAWFQEALTVFSQTEGGANGDVMGQANIGITAREMGNFVLARQWLDPALIVARQQRDDWTLAFVAGNLAEACRGQGDLEQAEALATESLRLFEQSGDALYSPEPLLTLAKLALARGDLTVAGERCAEVLRRYQALGDGHGIATALQAQAWLALAETTDAAGAERAAQLWETAQPLRAGANRALSPVERSEHAALADALARRLGARR